MILFDLFYTFFKIGLFAIGGAYSFLPLIEKEVVEKNQWLTKPEFLDVLGVVQIFPGAISIKYASYTGYKMAGILGAIAANVGNFLAPAILMVLAGMLYLQYKEVPIVQRAFSLIELTVFAMIVAVAFKTLDVKNVLNLRSISIIVIAFLIFLGTKIHPSLIILGAALLGALGLV